MDVSFCLTLVRNGDADSMNLLLNSGCIDTDDEELQILLYHSIISDAVEILEQLLKYGVDPNTQLSYIFTPEEKNLVGVAISKKKCEILKLLINYGAKIDINDHTFIMNVVDYQPTLRDELLDIFYANVSLNSFHNFGYTALHLAAMDNNPDYVKFLLKRGAKVSIPCKDKQSMTPLRCLLDRRQQNFYNFEYRYCILRGKEEKAFFRSKIMNIMRIVKILLQSGADVNSYNGYRNVIESVNECGKKFKGIICLLIRHVAMLQFLNQANISNDLIATIESNFTFKSYYDSCRQELERMKKEITVGVNVEFCFLLNRKSRDISKCIIANFYDDKTDIQVIFQDYIIYHDLLINNFKFSLHRGKLWNNAAFALIKLSKCSALTVHHIVINYILSFLGDDDLTNLTMT